MLASLCVSVPLHPGMQDRQMVPVQDPSPPNFSKSLLYLLLSACSNTDRRDVAPSRRGLLAGRACSCCHRWVGLWGRWKEGGFVFCQ